MRVVVLHESPGADRVAGEFRRAAEEFNRGLDIRLRFLDVGFEIQEVPVAPGAPAPPDALEDVLRRFRPGVVLALGRGATLLDCATAALRAPARLVYLVNGEPERPDEAVARLANLLVVPEGASVHGARGHPIRPDEPAGPQLVDILVKFVRERRGR